MLYVIDVLTLTAILAVAVHGYMLIKGLAGLLHLGHAVFYGLGAYGAAILAVKVLPPGTFPLAVLGGALVAAAGAVVIGWPALKARGRYFMIVTFAMQLIFITLVINLSITGGPDGLSSIPRISLGPWQPGRRWSMALGPVEIGLPQAKLAVMWAFAGLSFWICHRVIRSPYGRLIRAVREDERVVEAYGVDATRAKLSILVIGAAVTGAAGALFAHHFNYVGPSQYELDLTMLLLAMLILGGQYSLKGATLGAVLMMALLEALRFVLDNGLGVPLEMTAQLRQVAYAVVLILILAVRSKGLVPDRLVQYGRPAQALPAQARPAAPDTTVTELGEVVLAASNLEKHFGGLTAVAGAGLSLRKGRIIAIIGSNGAGKTTVFNMLSGFESADGGQAHVGGLPILGLGPAAIARLGVARTFQDVRIWNRLSVIENVLAASPRQPGRHPLRLFAQPGRVAAAEAANLAKAWALLERFGLADKANEAGSDLSYAQRKMLALARITAFDPKVMMLDEPTSGVDPRKLDVFLDHIRSFAVGDHRAVCLIEHNMAVVKELADWVLFMDEGKVVSSGTPRDVLGDHALMRRYLGHKKAATA
jgi:branched-chain amino acid transport system permease protein